MFYGKLSHCVTLFGVIPALFIGNWKVFFPLSTDFVICIFNFCSIEIIQNLLLIIEIIKLCLKCNIKFVIQILLLHLVLAHLNLWLHKLLRCHHLISKPLGQCFIYLEKCHMNDAMLK